MIQRRLSVKHTWNQEPLPPDSYFKPQKGHLVVAFHRGDGSTVSVLTPEDVETNCWDNLASVLASNLDGVEAGDRVLVTNLTGKHFSNVSTRRDYVYRRIAVLGTGRSVVKGFEKEDMQAVMPGVVRDGVLQPYGDNVFLDLPIKQGMYGALHLPDNMKTRSGQARVVAVGPSVDGISVGDTVIYSQGALHQMWGIDFNALDLREMLPGVAIEGELVACRAAGILCVLGDDE